MLGDEIGVGRLSDDDEQNDAMRDDSRKLVGLISDPGVVGHAYPPFRGDSRQPRLI